MNQIKKLISLIVIINLTAQTQIQAQNFVSNGSFEEKLTCPKEINQFDYLDIVANWEQPTKGTVDYLNSCNKSSLGVPKNIFGYMPAKDGKAYIGMYCYSKHPFFYAPFGNNYREYFETKLNAPLVNNKVYCVKMYVAFSKESSVAIDGMGMYLSKTKIQHKSDKVFRYSPQISNKEGHFLDDSNTWVPICGIYQAKGGEQYLTIGNFKTDAQIKKKYGKITWASDETSYYYIDDVSVIEVSDSSQCDCKTAYNTQRVILTQKPKKKSSFKTKDSFKIVKEFILNDVNFDKDQWVLNSNSYQTLDKVVEELSKSKSLKIIVIGYTDSIGSDSYNIELSQRRALAVEQYFIRKGISNERITTKGLGKVNPIDVNDTEEGRRKNRRVEIKIYKL